MSVKNSVVYMCKKFCVKNYFLVTCSLTKPYTKTATNAV